MTMPDVWHTANPIMRIFAVNQFSLTVDNEVTDIFGESWLSIAADEECIIFILSTLARVYWFRFLRPRLFIVDGHVGPTICIHTHLWWMNPAAPPIHGGGKVLLLIFRQYFKVVAVLAHTPDEKLMSIAAFSWASELNLILWILADLDKEISTGVCVLDQEWSLGH
jgi:hypothetical protein